MIKEVNQSRFRPRSIGITPEHETLGRLWAYWRDRFRPGYGACANSPLPSRAHLRHPTSAVLVFDRPEPAAAVQAIAREAGGRHRVISMRRFEARRYLPAVARCLEGLRCA